MPYLQKSRGDFPPSLNAETVLTLTFEFIDDWKMRLFNMIYTNTTAADEAFLTFLTHFLKSSFSWILLFFSRLFKESQVFFLLIS